MDEHTGVATWTLICFFLSIALTCYVTYYYARPKTPPPALVFTFLAWLASFSICYLVPNDLLSSQYSSTTTTSSTVIITNSTTNSTSNSTITNVIVDEDEHLKGVWTALFWLEFVLMWFIIPFASGYYDNGEFTPRARARASLRFNLLLLSILAVLAIIFIIYGLAVHKTMGEVADYAVMLSNLWGLIMLVFLAGYGLVAIPRELYYRSNLVRRRDEMMYLSASTHHEWVEVKDEAIATFKLVHSWRERVEQAANNNLQPHWQTYYSTIVAYMSAAELELQNVHGHPSDNETIDKLRAIVEIDEAALVKLNFHVIQTIQHLDMVVSQKNDVIQNAIYYEDALGGQHDNAPPASLAGKPLRRLWWYITVGFRRRVYLAAAILTALLSFFILFAEITIPTKNKKVSPLAAIIDASLTHPLSEQIFTCLPIMYLSLAAYYPLFKMRLSTFYYIGKRRTNENSLLTNATLVLRVSVPLAYNFILLLQQEGKKTALQSFTGPIDRTIPFFGSSFNEWFPVVMVVVSFLTVVRVSDWALRVLGREQFEFKKGPHSRGRSMGKASSSSDDEEETESAALIAEGRTIVSTYRRKQQNNNQIHESVTASLATADLELHVDTVSSSSSSRGAGASSSSFYASSTSTSSAPPSRRFDTISRLYAQSNP